MRTTSQLTLTDIKTALGRKLADPPPMPLPTIDAAELEEFNHPAMSWRGRLALVSLVMLAALLGIVMWRWRRLRRGGTALGIFLLVWAASGCGYIGPPVIKLSAGFQTPTFLHDGRSGSLPMTLLVRNDGNVKLRLLSAEGGCSCRRVDQAVFPRVLRPGSWFQGFEGG